MRFFFFSRGGDPREQFHIHVTRAGADAKIWIEPAVRVARSKGFSPAALRRLVLIFHMRAVEIREA